MLLHKNNIIVYKHHKTFLSLSLSVGFFDFLLQSAWQREGYDLLSVSVYYFDIWSVCLYTYIHEYGCNQKLCTIKE